MDKKSVLVGVATTALCVLGGLAIKRCIEKEKASDKTQEELWEECFEENNHDCGWVNDCYGTFCDSWGKDTQSSVSSKHPTDEWCNENCFKGGFLGKEE